MQKFNKGIGPFMTQEKSIIFTIQFLDLLYKPLPDLYHEIRILGERDSISAGKSNGSGKGVPISRKPGTVLEIIVENPLTKKRIELPQCFVVPSQKGTLRIQAPFYIQKVNLTEHEGAAGDYKRGFYKVLKGESLDSIAKKFETTWQVLFNLNKHEIKKADEIFPDQWLKIPPKSSGLRGSSAGKTESLKNQPNYKVNKGETLSGISQRSGVSVSELQRINGISDPKTLQAGKTIKLRDSHSVSQNGNGKTQSNKSSQPSAKQPSKDGNNLDDFLELGSEMLSDIKEGYKEYVEPKVEHLIDSVVDVFDGATGKSTSNKIGSSKNSSNRVYTVKSGDYLGKIGQNFGVSASQIANANGINVNDTILVGQKLSIPKASSVGSNSLNNSSTPNPIIINSNGNNSADGSPKTLLTTDGSCVCKTYDLIWGAKVNCEFRKKVIEICQDLWPDDYLNMANNLMAVMALETGRSFDPKVDNGVGLDDDGYGYVGLIQFGNLACIDLNIKKRQLIAMSDIEQLDWVKKYFSLRGREKFIKSFVDLYITVLYPQYLVKKGSSAEDKDILFDYNNKAYKQNPSFFREDGELDRTKVITKKNGTKIKKYQGFEKGATYVWEVKEVNEKFFSEGEQDLNKNFKATCSQFVQPPATNNSEFTVQFLDEKTKKAIEGFGYIIESKKYGSRTHSTKAGGKKTHTTIVGDHISVKVHKGGKVVELENFTVAHRIATKVYEVEKPKTSSLINRATAGKRYVKIPDNYWILGERANINRPNKFDDMIHLMLGEKLIKSVKGTTHPGVQSLTNPDKYNSARTGSPVWDFGWHYGVWSKGRHRRKIDAFTHTGVAYINRDTNRNNVPDNSGASKAETGKGLNFHPASYKPTGSSSTIGTWSTGCVVVQSATDYYQIFNTIIKSGQNKLTFCIVAGDI